MESNDRKKMIQQGFDTVAAGYDHPSLFFFPETAKRLVEQSSASVWNVGYRSLLTNFVGSKIERTRAACKANYRDVICNQLSEEELELFEKEHRGEIAELLGEEGVWFGTGVLVGVGVR